MILVRFLLISLIVYLIIRSFIRYGNGNEPENHQKRAEDKGKSENKKISKSIGEYVDYEEMRNEDF